MRVIAKFNGFILDSQYSDEEIKTRLTSHFRKKITDHVKKMLTDRETCNIDWEQRRFFPYLNKRGKGLLHQKWQCFRRSRFNQPHLQRKEQ